MVEASADAKGAFADGGVFETGAKLATGKAAHATRVALGTEPCAGVSRRSGQPEATGMERSQTGPATYHQACHAQPTLTTMLEVVRKACETSWPATCNCMGIAIGCLQSIPLLYSLKKLPLHVHTLQHGTGVYDLPRTLSHHKHDTDTHVHKSPNISHYSPETPERPTFWTSLKWARAGTKVHPPTTTICLSCLWGCHTTTPRTKNKHMVVDPRSNL